MLKNLEIWKKYAQHKDIIKINKYSSEKIDTLFSKELSFGTAGARAKMDIGSNAFNIYTVRQITYAYLKYLKTNFKLKDLSEKGIVIFHDNRHNGKEFVEETAKILNNNSVKVWISKKNELKTTPFISFVILELKLLGGMNFTASHNPKEYQGCKIYNDKGYQLLPNDTNFIAKEMKFEHKIFLNISQKNSKLLLEINDEVENKYINEVKKISFNNNLDKKINILFSAQHGTAYKIIPSILKSNNYNVDVFTKFNDPDPDFKNIKHINPEDPRAFEPLIKYSLKTKKYDCIFMVDPDGDRFAVAIKKENNTYQTLNGNEIATIFLFYIISMTKLKNDNLSQYFFVTTHVSSPLTSIMAKTNKIQTYITDTGFKWIADTIYQKSKYNNKFLFGYEEAIGFLPSDIVLDKDGIQSCVLFADIINYYRSINIFAENLLDIIYKKYSKYIYKSVNYILENNNQKLMFVDKINQLTLNIGNVEFSHNETIISDKELNPTFKYYLNDENSFLAIRFSGTEPKIKLYFCFQDIEGVNAKNKILDVVKYFDNVYQNIKLLKI